MVTSHNIKLKVVFLLEIVSERVGKTPIYIIIKK